MTELAGVGLAAIAVQATIGFGLRLRKCYEGLGEFAEIRLFAALAEGGEIQMPLQEMFWGAYYGSLRDRFGTQWMFNCTAPA